MIESVGMSGFSNVAATQLSGAGATGGAGAARGMNIADASQATGAPQATGANEATEAADFKAALMQHLDQADQMQQGADKAIGDLAAGRSDELANVMIAKTKTDLAFQMLAQVRQQMDRAYQEIERFSK
jgi:flagellar hook-basal body complex protein FliE